MTPGIEIRKLTPTIGAEVFGVDLGARLRGDQLTEIRAALLENLVIFFRDQTLSQEEHKAFGRAFGKLHIHPFVRPATAEHPEIIAIENINAVAEAWHTDVSCEEEPPMGSILYMHEVPKNGGGDTLFSNMYAAYEALSEPMRRFLEGLTAIHDASVSRRLGDHVDQRKDLKNLTRATHPVIRTHPETGRKCLYVNSVFTQRIVQLSEGESFDLLRHLFRHIENPHFQCRFKWAPRSVAFWDNRCTQHQPIWDYRGYRRYAQRVTICGDRPFYRI